VTNKSGFICRVCTEPLVLFYRLKGDVVVTIDCSECGFQKFTSLDDIISSLPIQKCCNKDIFEYARQGSDVIIMVKCTHCLNRVGVSMEDGVDALGDDDFEPEEFQTTIPLSDLTH